MKKQTKNTIITTIVVSTILTSSIMGIYEYKNDQSFRRELNKFGYSNFIGLDFCSPTESIKYSDFNFTDTYYVHKNAKRTIVSDKKEIEGYECLGSYFSMSSAEEIFYLTYYYRGDERHCYKTVSYDEMEKDSNKIFDFYDDFGLIDENSPEELSAYVPDCSIRPLENLVKKK